VLGSPITDMIEGQRKGFNLFVIVVTIIVWIMVGFSIIWLMNSPLGLQPESIGFLLIMAMAPVLFLLCVNRSQASFFTGFVRMAKQAELRSIPKYCPNCGGQIDLDEVSSYTGDMDINCPYCGTRLR
jgi:hypothetical protein